VPEPKPELARELAAESATAPEGAPGAVASAGARARGGSRCSATHHHIIAAPQLHEINRDKVVSGVIGDSEFNGGIRIVIGPQ